MTRSFSQKEQLLLVAVRTAIGHPAMDVSAGDWNALYHLALDQGVGAIAMDGLSQLGLLDQVGVELKLQWIVFSAQTEEQYAKHLKAVGHLAEKFAISEWEMLLLKGYGLSKDYPVPQHRPVGDMDIFVLDSTGAPIGEKADCMVQQWGISVDHGHEHHTVFEFDGQMVENHYDFVNTKGAPSARKVEALLKALTRRERMSAMADGKKIYIPSPTWNALFLMRHMGQHFAGERIVVRHLLDWGLMLEYHSSEVDWNLVKEGWHMMGIERFARALNSVCVRYLGFGENLFGGMLSDDQELTDRVMADILEPEFKGGRPTTSKVKDAAFRAHRYFANGWKRKMVYREGLVAGFLWGVWGKR